MCFLSTSFNASCKDCSSSSLTYAKPKINKKPFIFYQLKILEKYNFNEVIICAGHLSTVIKDFLKNKKFRFKLIFINDGKKLLGTGGAIKKIYNKLNNFFFVTYGDTILEINYDIFWNYFLRSSKNNIMSIKKNLYFSLFS